MLAADLPEIASLAAGQHPDLPEADEVFAEKLRLFPAGCFALDRGDGDVAGYCFAHPWSGDPPALDTLLERLPDPADYFFMHDIVVAPAHRRSGHARRVVGLIDAAAREHGLGRLLLISVNATETYWAALGFRASDEGAENVRRSYGGGAVLMERGVAREHVARNGNRFSS